MGKINDVTYFKGTQVTGITISENVRMLVNFPRWRDGVPFSVAEVKKGMMMDKKGNLYMGDLEKSAVVYLTPDKTEIYTLVEGGKISWPDTFAIYNDELYFTNSRIHEAVGDISEMIFPVNKVKLP